MLIFLLFIDLIFSTVTIQLHKNVLYILLSPV